jgi:hypothetical protein
VNCDPTARAGKAGECSTVGSNPGRQAENKKSAYLSYDTVSRASDEVIEVCNFAINGRFTNRRKSMKRILLAGMIAALALGPAMAQETCATKAVDKNGKPLAGAALNSFLKKCKREACEPKAVSAEGKKLSGAAKNSFMQKCERDA